MRRTSRRLVLMSVTALVSLASLIPPIPAGAATADDVAAAQRRADQAAAAVAEAEVELAFATDAVTRAREQVAATEAAMAEARDRLAELALRQYVNPSSPLPFLTDISDAQSASLAREYSAVAAGGSVDALGRFRAQRQDLEAQLNALSDQEVAEGQTLAQLRRQEATVMAELERLAALDRQRREQEAAATARQPAAANPAPRAGSAPASGGGGWVCPVAGPHSFTNDFGAPRAGGRSHQGIDLLAPRGTPVVAHVSGVVSRNSNRLGGLAYFLKGDDGNTYYGAHLDTYGAQGRVGQGTVIGTVGDSGDAIGGPPHLHFEMSRPGSGTVNPFGILRQFC